MFFVSHRSAGGNRWDTSSARVSRARHLAQHGPEEPGRRHSSVQVELFCAWALSRERIEKDGRDARSRVVLHHARVCEAGSNAAANMLETLSSCSHDASRIGLVTCPMELVKVSIWTAGT